jgi:hypothetical protein
MIVHVDPLQRFLPFQKCNSLLVSSNPYNWIQTEMYFALINYSIDRVIEPIGIECWKETMVIAYLNRMMSTFPVKNAALRTILEHCINTFSYHVSVADIPLYNRRQGSLNRLVRHFRLRMPSSGQFGEFLRNCPFMNTLRPVLLSNYVNE